jgi:hypothetical protein
VNDSFHEFPEFNQAFCTRCGASTLKECPNCGREIEGRYRSTGVLSLSDTPVPDICKYCGQDFPWRVKDHDRKTTSSDASSSVEDKLEMIFKRFHLLVKQLRRRYNDRATLDVQDEYDVQDLLHTVLRLFFDDIRTEEWNPSYAGSSSRSDFLLKQEKTIIEVKKTRNTLKAKQLGEQLIIDIARYKAHPDCNILYCFVYDPDGYINNPKGIENDLNKLSDKIEIRVYVVP